MITMSSARDWTLKTMVAEWEGRGESSDDLRRLFPCDYVHDYQSDHSTANRVEA